MVAALISSVTDVSLRPVPDGTYVNIKNSTELSIVFVYVRCFRCAESIFQRGFPENRVKKFVLTI